MSGQCGGPEDKAETARWEAEKRLDQPYPPFSGDDVICPKCGGMVGKSYQPAGTVFTPGRLTARLGKGPEWLRRACGDCGYAWPEMCADSDATPCPECGRPLKQEYVELPELGGTSSYVPGYSFCPVGHRAVVEP